MKRRRRLSSSELRDILFLPMKQQRKERQDFPFPVSLTQAPEAADAWGATVTRAVSAGEVVLRVAPTAMALLDPLSTCASCLQAVPDLEPCPGCESVVFCPACRRACHQLRVAPRR